MCNWKLFSEIHAAQDNARRSAFELHGKEALRSDRAVSMMPDNIDQNLRRGADSLPLCSTVVKAS
jgi:hypothetical protein